MSRMAEKRTEVFVFGLTIALSYFGEFEDVSLAHKRILVPISIDAWHPIGASSESLMSSGGDAGCGARTSPSPVTPSSTYLEARRRQYRVPVDPFVGVRGTILTTFRKPFN